MTVAPRFLASVTDVAEAVDAVAGGADILDAKDPASGALGALPLDTIAAIVATARASGVQVSATVGDLPCEPRSVRAAVDATLATGVDYVKIGLYPGAQLLETISALGRASAHPQVGERQRLVGVLIADQNPDFTMIGHLAAAGFSGVMLDTAAKDGRSLCDALTSRQLITFIETARAAGVFAGLAGSLKLSHVAKLANLGPDVLGFRGALCAGSSRTGRLLQAHVRDVRMALDKAQPDGASHTQTRSTTMRRGSAERQPHASKATR